jgi:hypothetical protein
MAGTAAGIHPSRKPANSIQRSNSARVLSASGIARNNVGRPLHETGSVDSANAAPHLKFPLKMATSAGALERQRCHGADVSGITPTVRDTSAPRPCGSGRAGDSSDKTMSFEATHAANCPRRGSIPAPPAGRPDYHRRRPDPTFRSLDCEEIDPWQRRLRRSLLVNGNR